MSGLVIKLKPQEKMLLNGVLVQNGERAAKLRIRTEGAHVLRMRDALRPTDAATPARHLYYVAQLALVGEVEREPARDRLLEGLAALAHFYTDDVACADVERARAAVEADKFFAAMRALRRLFPIDDALFLPKPPGSAA